MLTKRDQVLIAVKLVSDEDINGVRVAEFLELLAQFLRLAVLLMLAVIGIVNTLNSWADAFWEAWDNAGPSLRWRLCPIRVTPMG